MCPPVPRDRFCPVYGSGGAWSGAVCLLTGQPAGPARLALHLECVPRRGATHQVIHPMPRWRQRPRCLHGPARALTARDGHARVHRPAPAACVCSGARAMQPARVVTAPSAASQQARVTRARRPGADVRLHGTLFPITGWLARHACNVRAPPAHSAGGCSGTPLATDHMDPSPGVNPARLLNSGTLSAGSRPASAACPLCRAASASWKEDRSD